MLFTSNIQSKQALSIAAFFDGRPGHEKQTRGILQALKALTPITVYPVRVELDVWSASLAWCSFLLRLPIGKKLLTGLPKKGIDLLLGTGSRTHAPMLLGRRKFPAARLVVCMAPPNFIARHFDLLFVPRHDGLRSAANLVETFGPPNTCTAAGPRSQEKGLILVGGVDEKSHRWQTEDVVNQIRAVAEQYIIPWTIATSRRTPAETELALAALSHELPHLHMVPARDTCPGWIEARYNESALVWVTADSVSMVYEALSAGCRVGVLPVNWKRADNKFQRGLDVLHEQRMIIFFDEWLQGATLPESAPLNEADRCVRELLCRFWPTRLPEGITCT